MVAPKYPLQYDDVVDITAAYLPELTDNTQVKDFLTRIRAALLSVEHELGIKPSGSYATVSQRLDAISGGGGGTGAEVDISIPPDAIVPTAGQVVYIKNDGSATGVVAVASGDATVPAVCRAIGVITNVGTIRIAGVANTTADGYIFAGDKVYLSVSIPGAVTAIAPFGVLQAQTMIGVATTDAVAGFCNIKLQIEEPNYLPIV